MREVPTFQAGYESGDLSQWDAIQVDADIPLDQQIKVQSQVRRSHKYAAKFTVHPGQQFKGGTSERAEVLRHKVRAEEGENVWYSWATKLPRSFVVPSRWAIIWQAHAVFPWQAPVVVSLRKVDGDEFIEITVNGGYLVQTADGYWNAPVVRRYRLAENLGRGIWRDYAVHIWWSVEDGGIDGYWRNSSGGEWAHSVHAAHIPTLQHHDNFTSKVYTKHGLYRNAEAFTNTLYHDRYRQGPSSPLGGDWS